jgi:hypothetical protein
MPTAESIFGHGRAQCLFRSARVHQGCVETTFCYSCSPLGSVVWTLPHAHLPSSRQNQEACSCVDEHWRAKFSLVGSQPQGAQVPAEIRPQQLIREITPVGEGSPQLGPDLSCVHVRNWLSQLISCNQSVPGRLCVYKGSGGTPRAFSGGVTGQRPGENRWQKRDGFVQGKDTISKQHRGGRVRSWRKSQHSRHRLKPVQPFWRGLGSAGMNRDASEPVLPRPQSRASLLLAPGHRSSCWTILHHFCCSSSTCNEVITVAFEIQGQALLREGS